MSTPSRPLRSSGRAPRSPSRAPRSPSRPPRSPSRPPRSPSLSRGRLPARTRDRRGSLSVEAVIIVPGLVLMLGLMIAGGRLWFARTTVTEAAYSAARAASLARDANQARTDGEQAAVDQLGTRDLSCLDRQVNIDTAAFAVPVGEAATVHSHLECRISFADVVLPGLPGSMLLQADGASALDTYRQR